MTRALRVLALLTAGFLASCGGGSSGGFSPTTPDLAITADNAFDVASAVVTAISGTFDFSGAVGDDFGGDAVAAQSRLQLFAAGTALARAHALAQSGRIGPAVAFPPETEPCLASGTITISGNVANPPDIGVGDSITIVFNDCDDGDGYVLDGRLDLVIRQVQGDPLSEGPYLLRADMELTDLTLTEGTEVTSADGSFSLTLDTRNAPVSITRLVGELLKLAAGTEELTLSGFDHRLEENLAAVPSTHQATASGTLASNILGGKVSYLTEQGSPIIGLGDDDPYTGVIRITGAASSRVRVVIVDNTLVTLEVDADGDGVAESSIDTTWPELNGEEPSSVTTQNAVVVASEAYAAVNRFGSSGTAVGQQFQQQNTFGQLASLAVSGDFGPEAVSCPGGGQVTVSGSVQVAGTYTTGDTLDATFNDCISPQGTNNGQMLVNVAAYTQLTTNTYVFNGTATLTAFERTLGATPTFTANGTLSHSWDATSVPPLLQVQTQAANFQIQEGVVERRLSNALNQADILVSPPGVTEVDAAGILRTSLLDGAYNYLTVESLVTTSDNDPATGPGAGALKVIAADGSSVTLVAIDDLAARLDIDLDGDGDVDVTQNVTWAQIQ